MLLAGWLIKSSRSFSAGCVAAVSGGALPVHMFHIKSHHVAQQVEFKKPRTVLWRETGWKTNQQTGEKEREPWKHLTPVFLDVPLRFKRCWCLVESSRGSWIPVISPRSAQECKKTCKRCRETEWIFWEFVNGHFFSSGNQPTVEAPGTPEGYAKTSARGVGGKVSVEFSR